MSETRKKGSWIKLSAMICSFGLFISIRPSEPYLTDYLMSPHQNLSESELMHDVYPTWTYTYLVLLLPIFIITDYTRYKPIIILHALGYVSSYLLLVFGHGLTLMKLMQVMYAFATAGEIGFYSYPYSVLEHKYFQKVTSYMRTCCLLGSFCGSLTAQLLVSLIDIDVFYLHVVTLCTSSIAFFISLFFPMPKTSLYYDNSKVANPGVTTEDSEIQIALNKNTIDDKSEEKLADSREEDQKDEKGRRSHMSVVRGMWRDVIECYSDVHLMSWSIYMILTMCGWLFIVGYIQNLWQLIGSATYNGAVESVATILGASSAFLVSFIKLNWLKWSQFAFAFSAFVNFLLVYTMAITTKIAVCYSCYSAYIFLFNFVTTIIQFQVASGLTNQRHALVFGMNTFVAVALNTVGTIVLLEDSFLSLPVRAFYIVISGYFGIIGITFIIYGIYLKCKEQPSTVENTQSSLPS